MEEMGVVVTTRRNEAHIYTGSPCDEFMIRSVFVDGGGRRVDRSREDTVYHNGTPMSGTI